MMKAWKDQSIVGEGSIGKKCMEVSSSDQKTNNEWPFRITLTTDHLRWDSLKISPSNEFEEHIVAKLSNASRKAFDAWEAVKIWIYDVDTNEIYEVELAKKESFWFDPIPDVGSKEKMFSPSQDLKEARKKFAYSIKPFKRIKEKRNLDYNQEIGLRWSGNQNINKFDFSVLYLPGLDLRSFRF